MLKFNSNHQIRINRIPHGEVYDAILTIQIFTQNSYRDPGVLLIWIIIEQGPTVLTVGAGSFNWTFVIPLFFLPVSERRLDID